MIENPEDPLTERGEKTGYSHDEKARRIYDSMRLHIEERNQMSNAPNHINIYSSLGYANLSHRWSLTILGPLLKVVLTSISKII